MRMIMCSKCASNMLCDKITVDSKKDKCQSCGKNCKCYVYDVVVNKKEDIDTF